jgi:hypothetical protein
LNSKKIIDLSNTAHRDGEAVVCFTPSLQIGVLCSYATWIYRRIWYEADINYTSGYRGTERILYSNDGLIFVTYDHYQTFYEIQIKE